MVSQILGYTPEEILQIHFYDLSQPEEREALKQEVFRVFASRQPFREFLNRNRHRDGRSVWLATNGVPLLDAAGGLRGYRGTNVVKHDEPAMTDALTGVLNRHGFQLLAEQQLKMATRNRIPVALLFADVDDLKTINDRDGHAEGDRTLARVAAAIRASTRESDVVARFGGDEFVVLLPFPRGRHPENPPAATRDYIVVSL
jgi:GGDEF domain-containing protein